MSTKDNQNFSIPMEITRENAIWMGIDPELVRPIRIGNRKTTGIFVPATEEQYRAYMQDVWREEQQNVRHSRCIVKGLRGGTRRCTADCSQCPHKREGAALSLDQLLEDTGNTVAMPSPDTSNTALTKILLERLLDSLNQLDPELAQVFKLLYDGKSQREIATIIGAGGQSSVAKKIRKLREWLKRYVAREDIQN